MLIYLCIYFISRREAAESYYKQPTGYSPGVSSVQKHRSDPVAYGDTSDYGTWPPEHVPQRNHPRQYHRQRSYDDDIVPYHRRHNYRHTYPGDYRNGYPDEYVDYGPYDREYYPQTYPRGRRMSRHMGEPIGGFPQYLEVLNGGGVGHQDSISLASSFDEVGCSTRVDSYGWF